MSEFDASNFDEDFLKIRKKIASQKNEWYRPFNERNSIITLTIFSVLFVNTVLDIYALLMYLVLIPIIYLIVPNIAWGIFCFPYFFLKIKKLNKLIEDKRQESVINSFQKHHNVNEIVLDTGISKQFVEYYLTKNNLVLDSNKMH